jgi:BMFP domain-containing protein YqiC
MQTRNPILDDLARVATGAMSALGGVKEEVEARVRDQFARILDGMDLVRREEFDAVKAMAAKAREENEALTQRIAALEARLGSDPASHGTAAGGTASGTAVGA